MGSEATREELLALVARINAAAESLDTSDTCEVSKAREALSIECKKLIASVEDETQACIHTTRYVEVERRNEEPDAGLPAGQALRECTTRPARGIEAG